MSELVKIEQQELVLKDSEVAKIEQSFQPIASELEGLNEVYAELIKSEITEELCTRAKLFYTLLKKANGANDKIHKSQKAYFLAGGNFADKQRNKNRDIIDVMKEKTLPLINHFENIENERIAKIESERNIELSKYEPDMIIPNLGGMDESVWKNFLNGIISGYNLRKEEEADAEKERLRLIEVEKETARLKAIEDERIRNENAKLKEEADKRERLEKIERQKREKVEKERLEKEAAVKKERDERDRKEKEAFELELKIEREKREKIEREEKERRDKVIAKVKAKQLSDKKASQAPDKDKLIKSINEMVFIDSEFKTVEAEAVYNVINQKFEAFKIWAISQTKSL